MYGDEKKDKKVTRRRGGHMEHLAAQTKKKDEKKGMGGK